MEVLMRRKTISRPRRERTPKKKKTAPTHTISKEKKTATHERKHKRVVLVVDWVEFSLEKMNTHYYSRC